MRRRVTALRVGLAHVARLLHVGADQPVDDGALADAGRPEQRARCGRARRRRARASMPSPLRGLRTCTGSRRPPRPPRRRAPARRRTRSGLVSRTTGVGAALARQQQVALEAARAEVGVERHDQEDDVHVGGDDLLVGDAAGHLAREPAAARQHVHDRRAVLVAPRPDHDPVADRRQLAAALGVVLQPARHDGLDLAVRPRRRGRGG